MRNTVSILGIPIDDLNSSEVLDRLEDFIASKRFHQVATANVDFLVKSHADPELKRILRSADLIMPDGMPIVWASRLLRAGLRERVTGADLVFPLAERAALKGYRIFMLGGERDVASEARSRLESRFPDLRIVACESPDIPNLITTDVEDLLKRIEEANPDILLVAFGNPKQEKFIHMHRGRLKVPVCIGVGGTFDFIAGKTKRAPLIVQRLGLEFLHRWSQNPRRLGPRYKANLITFPPLILRQIRSVVRSPISQSGPVSIRPAGEATVVAASGEIRGAALKQVLSSLESTLTDGRNIVFDFTGARGIDSMSLGILLSLWKLAERTRGEVRIVGANALMRRAMEASDSLDLFRDFNSVDEAVAAGPVPGFSLCVSSERVGVTLALCGFVGVEHGPELGSRLQEFEATKQLVCLDLKDVSYIDSHALHLLHRFADNRRARNLDTTSALSDQVIAALSRQKLDSLT